MILREVIDGKVCTSFVARAFEETYDVIVAGLGTAGAISLITAGREGLSVLGVEQLAGMGGTGTFGGVIWYYFGAKGGLYEELDEKEEAMRGKLFVKESGRRDTLSLVLQREAEACGAKIKYDCIVTGVYMEENKVVGLRLFQDGKEIHVGAQAVIDTTGEANVCFLAGCEMLKGREFDDQMQPATTSSAYMRGDDKIYGTNKDAGFVKQTDPRDVSRTILRSHNFPMYLKDDYEKEEMTFIGVSPLFGVREGRRIKGKHVLRMRDLVNTEREDGNPIFYAYSNVDNHGKDGAFENEELCDWMAASGLWGVLMSVPVPMEALLPEKVENLLVAGRCLSVDHNLASCVRMKRDMQKSGEAAAYIASIAVKNGIALSEVPYAELEEKLRKTKCLNDENNVGFMERLFGQYWGDPLPKVQTPEEIVARLAGEKPGWAIWAAREHAEDQNLRSLIANGLESSDERFSRHCALALGIMGDEAAIPKLREMAAEPDHYVPKSSLKYVYTRGVSAIYLLGKLGDTESMDLLFGHVERRGVVEIPGFEFGEFYGEAADVYSQYVLFSARALVEIGRRKAEKKQEIRNRLLELLRDPAYKLMITLRENSKSLCDLKPKLIEYIETMMG